MNFFKPAKFITRGDNRPYLIRKNLFECKYFSIKVHTMLDSDDACLHDHPWSFITFILKGGYVERYVYKWVNLSNYEPNIHGSNIIIDADNNRIGLITTKIIHPFTLHYRPANWTHSLEIHQQCKTFVITFKKTRQWGFWTNTGWIKWFLYSKKDHCD